MPKLRHFNHSKSLLPPSAAECGATGCSAYNNLISQALAVVRWRSSPDSTEHAKHSDEHASDSTRTRCVISSRLTEQELSQRPGDQLTKNRALLLTMFICACGGRAESNGVGGYAGNASASGGSMLQGGELGTGGSSNPTDMLDEPNWESLTWTTSDMGSNGVLQLVDLGEKDAWSFVVESGFKEAWFVRQHWDGTSWTQTVDESGNNLFSEYPIWAFPEQQAVGNVWDISTGVGVGELDLYDGKSWQSWSNTPDCKVFGGSDMSDLWCGADDGLWHRNGSAWTSYDIPGCVGITSISRNDVWVWTPDHVSHFDGSNWTAQAALSLRALSASAADDVWALTMDGAVWHAAGAGTQWTSVIIPTAAGKTLHSIWARTKNDVWAVGDEGTLIRWTASEWSSVPSGTTLDLEAVSGSKSDIWIGGGVLIHGQAGTN